MGKSIEILNSSDSEEHQNQSKQQKKGAPYKMQPISKDNFWFYEKKALKLIQVLAQMGQLQFKIQSGTSASKFKQHYQNNFGQNYAKVKKERKAFLKGMTKSLNELQKKFKLSGNMNHYFLSQSSEYEFQISAEKTVTLPIHQDFIQSLDMILQILKSDDQFQKQQRLFDLINSIKKEDNHDFLQKWALTKAWMTAGVGKLQNLQQINEEYDYTNQRNDVFTTKDYLRNLQEKTYEELKDHFQSEIGSNIQEFLTAIDVALNQEQQD